MSYWTNHDFAGAVQTGTLKTMAGVQQKKLLREKEAVEVVRKIPSGRPRRLAGFEIFTQFVTRTREALCDLLEQRLHKLERVEERGFGAASRNRRVCNVLYQKGKNDHEKNGKWVVIRKPKKKVTRVLLLRSCKGSCESHASSKAGDPRGIKGFSETCPTHLRKKTDYVTHEVVQKKKITQSRYARHIANTKRPSGAASRRCMLQYIAQVLVSLQAVRKEFFLGWGGGEKKKREKQRVRVVSGGYTLPKSLKTG